ncbi:MAG: hypothetical protein RIB30_11190, partial [Thalassospira sp.]|uniref:hypothetical protein n=1 Tax=Thalassospira sp. TaxID=1912094 RepID=UPI0032F071E9
LSGRGSETKSAISKLEEIEQALMEFSSVRHWLFEAKEYHEKIQNLDGTLDELDSLCEKPFSEGRFNPDAFDYRNIRLAWRKVRSSTMQSVITVLQHQRHYASQVLAYSEDRKEVLSGEAFAVKFCELKRDIDDLLHDWSGSEEDKKKMCSLVGVLADHTRAQLEEADTQLIMHATKMADTLSSFAPEVSK